MEDYVREVRADPNFNMCGDVVARTPPKRKRMNRLAKRNILAEQIGEAAEEEIATLRTELRTAQRRKRSAPSIWRRLYLYFIGLWPFHRKPSKYVSPEYKETLKKQNAYLEDIFGQTTGGPITKYFKQQYLTSHPGANGLLYATLYDRMDRDRRVFMGDHVKW